MSWDFWSDNKDAILTILAVFGAVAGTIWAVFKWGVFRWWNNRIRVDVKIFEVISDPSVLLAKLYATENDDSSLADHNIKYQPRDPDRDTQAELKAALNRSRYLLITAPTGYGKTREGGMLAQTMMLEGWRVLRIRIGWLDVPKTLPEELNGNRSRVLIFLDDLNGLFSIGNLTQSPRVENEKTLMLSQLPYHDRLLQMLDMFEGMCTESEIRVIATARSESEQWNLLEFNKNDKLWKRFERIEISGPADTVIVNLLEDATKQADLKADENEFKAIAHKSDGTYRNILLNLRRYRSQNKPVSKDDFTDTLDGSWKDIFERAVKKHLAIELIYDAIDILRQTRIELFPFLVEKTALMIWGGNFIQKFLREGQVKSAVQYLIRETKIMRLEKDKLSPSDGQIEAKKHTVSWTLFDKPLMQLLLDLSDKKIISSIYGLAVTLYYEKQFEKASLLIDRYIQLNPSDLDGRNFAGVLFSDLKRYKEAEASYRKAIELNPSYAIAYSNLGILLKNLKRYEEAEANYRKAIELNPSLAQAYFSLGLLLHENLKRHEEAETSYRKAIELNPSLAQAYDGLGLLLHENLKRYEEASYRKAIELNPSDAVAYINLGYMLNDLNRYDEAETILQKAIELDPSNALAYLNLGNTLSDLKQNEEAETSFRKAIELNPSNAIAYSNLGSLLGDLERYEEAEASFRKAIELNPSLPEAYSNLGGLLSDENLKRYEEAEASLRKAIELNPSDATGYYNLGSLLGDLKRYEEAEASYRKAIELNPSYAIAYSNLGSLLYENLKQYEEAEASYRKAIELNPSLAQAYNNLTNLLRVTNKEREALPLLEKIIEIDPENFNSYLGVASIKKILGESIEPSFVEKARQYIPEDDFYNRVCLESVCDNFDLAFEHLQKAAQKEKFNPKWAWEDPDLQWIRNDPRFVEIVGANPEK